MKQLIYGLVLLGLLLSACSDKTLVLEKAEKIQPKFPIEYFKEEPNFELHPYIQENISPDDSKEEIVLEKNEAMNYIKRNKLLKKRYNLLREEIINFNQKIVK